MDEDSHFNAEFDFGLTRDEPGSVLQHHNFIASSTDFNISGGTFTSVINNYPSNRPSDLIPFEKMAELYCDSHLKTVYIYAFCHTEFELADVAPNCWFRLHSSKVPHAVLSGVILVHYKSGCSWLAHANSFFSRLRITSNQEKYYLVDRIHFEISFSISSQTHPEGTLFLCPMNEFQCGPSSSRWPDCPAYWSLDPLGASRLSTEEAERLGFPSIQLATKIYVKSWDEHFYAGLRKFHQVKGFDPDSQDVAWELYPQYELLTEADAPFAPVNLDDEVITKEDNESIYSRPTDAQSLSPGSECGSSGKPPMNIRSYGVRSG
ncbi:hypothetical protein K438DRAFT_1963106 [Mycena galopus ATCC 62051]|nr:hypothetical protein K438DRAFT_1963106 [Mycena galopus ATCC 62051]